jgi:Protein of unknown function (DUF3025)
MTGFAPMADFWNTEWLTRSAIFWPLRPVASRLPAIGWPNPELLSALAEDAGRVVNAQGLRVRFVPQTKGSSNFEDGFEPRCYLKGEVQVRPLDWHDLFNALAWMSFPLTKATLNARHMQAMETDISGRRSPERDALTMFDEDGVAILSSDEELLRLVREFRWKELFWEARERVGSSMRLLVVGHALYHKALRPFVGMTGKAILLKVPAAFTNLPDAEQIRKTDRLLAAHLWDRATLIHGRDLAPLPVLGVPGWWPANIEETFYDDTDYFRPGRRANNDQPS